MLYLIISDVHANWEALEAVLADAKGQYDMVCCLGDIVGYGADPNRVTDWFREHCSCIIRGNHDKACCGLEEATQFNPIARQAVEWTLDQLTPENRNYLETLHKGPIDVGPFLIVHGSVLDEDEYLLDLRDAATQFPHAPNRLVFFGHTHVQGAFLVRGMNGVTDATNERDAFALHLRDRDSAFVNPGSVGQPRDFLWESAYALYDSDTQVVRYRRVAYEVQRAQEKIRNAGLPEALAERIAVGR